MSRRQPPVTARATPTVARLFDLKALAIASGLDPRAAWAAARSGRLVVHRLGKKYMTTEAAWNEWLGISPAPPPGDQDRIALEKVVELLLRPMAEAVQRIQERVYRIAEHIGVRDD